MLALAVLAAQPAIADEGGAFEWTGRTKGTAGKNASVLEEACASVSEQCVMRGVRYILLRVGHGVLGPVCNVYRRHLNGGSNHEG